MDFACRLDASPNGLCKISTGDSIPVRVPSPRGRESKQGNVPDAWCVISQRRVARGDSVPMGVFPADGPPRPATNSVRRAFSTLMARPRPATDSVRGALPTLTARRRRGTSGLIYERLRRRYQRMDFPCGLDASPNGLRKLARVIPSPCGSHRRADANRNGEKPQTRGAPFHSVASLKGILSRWALPTLTTRRRRGTSGLIYERLRRRYQHMDFACGLNASPNDFHVLSGCRACRDTGVFSGARV